jgi:hypothetical protein
MSAKELQTAVYVNHGGIGFLASRAGELPISEAGRTQALRLVAAFDKKTLREVPAPQGGWDSERLAAVLEPLSPYILSFAPVDAYLGDECIGSTET